MPTEKPQGAATTDIEIDETYRPFVGKRLNIWTKEGENSSNHIERYGSLPINSSKRKISMRGSKSRAEKITVKGIGRKKLEIPLCEVELKSQWKTGPITVGVMDSLPMKGRSLQQGNEVEARATFLWKRTELNATDGRDETTTTTTRVEKGYNLRNGSRGEEMEEEINEISRIGKSREELIRE